ncbi:MAG TPA: hypothetical protein VJI70_00925 [Candidatus Paceibacterota bacterium]
MTNIGTSPDNRLAGLSADLFHKLQAGSLTLDELVLFTQRKNPFAFERNEHGHIVLTFVGLDLTGAQEIERLEGTGFRFGKYAKQCLMSRNSDSYDAKHRLVAGQMYKIALMPGREIEKDSDRTTANLQKRGMEHYGYGKPLAGLVPRYRERISDKQMEEMGFWYISSTHDPIKDFGGGPLVLSADRGGGGRWVYASWGEPDARWDGRGAFAFPVPAS